MSNKSDNKSVLVNKPTKAPMSEDKKIIKALTKEMYVQIEELHKRMRAEDKHSLLLVFQGMDASGKDGSIDKLYNGLYPMATEANAFKAPNNIESAHDFLWRIHKLTPPTGHIGIFNRSHYEDILVPTVHGLFDEDIIERRYEHINNFEQLLKDNNTHVIKFYLHISKEEQKARFKERKVLIEKRWKYNKNDLRESKLWDKYMEVYEKIFSTSKIPWDIIPADDKWYRNYLIAQRVLHKLLSLDMKYPEEIVE